MLPCQTYLGKNKRGTVLFFTYMSALTGTKFILVEPANLLFLLFGGNGSSHDIAKQQVFEEPYVMTKPRTFLVLKNNKNCKTCSRGLSFKDTKYSVVCRFPSKTIHGTCLPQSLLSTNLWKFTSAVPCSFGFATHTSAAYEQSRWRRDGNMVAVGERLHSGGKVSLSGRCI